MRARAVRGLSIVFLLFWGCGGGGGSNPSGMAGKGGASQMAGGGGQGGGVGGRNGGGGQSGVGGGGVGGQSGSGSSGASGSAGVAGGGGQSGSGSSGASGSAGVAGGGGQSGAGGGGQSGAGGGAGVAGGGGQSGAGGAVDPLDCATARLQSAVAAGTYDENVAANCGGSTPICCPGGAPTNPCGPLHYDFTMHTADAPRLVITPVPAASRDDVVLRARLTTVTPIPVTVPVVGDCGMAIDTTPGPTPDVQFNFSINHVVDTAGVPYLQIGTVTLTNLTTDDVALTGGLGCAIANLGLSFFLTTLTSAVADFIQQDLICNSCPCRP